MRRILRLAALLAPLLGVKITPKLYGALAKLFWFYAPAKNILKANFKRAGISASPELISETVRNFGRYLSELFSVLGKSESLSFLRGEVDIDSLKKTHESGRGAFALSPHFGNWEVGALILGEEFGGISVIIRTTGDKWLDERIKICRGRNRLFDVSKGVRPILRALEEKAIVAAAVDEPRSKGVEVKFMGANIFFPSAIFRMAEETDSALIPVRCKRSHEGKITVKSYEEVRTPQELADIFEEWIREEPTQWMLMERLE